MLPWFVEDRSPGAPSYCRLGKCPAQGSDGQIGIYRMPRIVHQQAADLLMSVENRPSWNISAYWTLKCLKLQDRISTKCCLIVVPSGHVLRMVFFLIWGDQTPCVLSESGRHRGWTTKCAWHEVGLSIEGQDRSL